MSDDETSYNSKPLDELIKAMKSKAISAKVGVLGQKDVRASSEKSGGTSNATIGAAHEFGTSKLPQRSFLRMPISEKLPQAIEQSGALNESSLKEIIKEGTFRNWVEKIAIMAVGTVLQAFDTGGYGSWPAVLPKTLERKKVKQILVETQQLRDSITYEIKS